MIVLRAARTARRQEEAALLTWPGSGVMVTELTALLGEAAGMYPLPLPVRDGPLRGRLSTLNQVLACQVGDASTRARTRAVLVGCCAARYLVGARADYESCREWDRAYGVRVATAPIAVMQLLQALRVRAITLVSPYDVELTGHACRYWQQAGVVVERVVGVSSGDRAVTGADVVTAVDRAKLPGDAVLVMAGASMPTLDVLPALGAAGRRTLISPAVASAWWLLRRLAPGLPPRRLSWPLRRLARQGAAP